jgi:polyisoprenoid-binding protein YceI
MRTRLYLGLAILPALLAASAAPASFEPGSKVWVSGTSTVRAYRCETTRAEGTAQLSGTDLASLRVSGASVTIPVSTLDCANGTMNGHMRTALKMAESPNIRFRATNVEVNGTAAKMTGELTIAGSTQPVSIDATVASESGQLRVRGSKQLDMTTYGVRPPSLMMGTMKVRPGVTIGFDVLLKP